MRPCLDNKAMDARVRDKSSLCWFGCPEGGGLVECRVGVGHCRGQRPGEARGLGCTRDNGCVSGQLTIIWCREGVNFIIWAQVKEED